MTAAPQRRRSGLAGVFHGAWEILAFALTAIGALAALLMGHWYQDVPAANDEPDSPTSAG
jgi:hypothetical protein